MKLKDAEDKYVEQVKDVKMQQKGAAEGAVDPAVGKLM